MLNPKKTTISALVFALLAALTLLGVRAMAAGRKLPVYCVGRDDRKVALTFDAAWGNEDTADLIRILGEHKAPATFFVVNQWVEKYPESVLQLHEAGHDVMNHSTTHPHCSKISRDALIRELETCNDGVEAVTGVRPSLFRPPFGDYNDTVIETVTSLGMTAIQWDVDSLDWKDLSAAEITKRVTERVKPGSIILFHNAAKHTPEALPAILDWLEKNDYEPVLVRDLLLEGETRIDVTGRQWPAEG